jgi:hypothetical protein
LLSGGDSFTLRLLLSATDDELSTLCCIVSVR